MKIGVILQRNKKMQEFLQANGFPFAVAKYIDKGSMRGTWRVYSRPKAQKGVKVLDTYGKWSSDTADKFNSIGFTDIWGRPLTQHSGNGGYFSVFVRGHNEFLID